MGTFYKSDDKANVANPFGSKSAVTLSGSGDVDGFGTASFSAVINDNNPAGYLSHLITLDMGDMGMVGLTKVLVNLVHQQSMTNLQLHGKSLGTTQVTHQVD